MNRGSTIAAAAGLAAALGLGYWWGARSAGPSAPSEPEARPTAAAARAPAGERRILYYRHPMGLPDTSPVPKKDSMGMDYVPVYSDEAPSGPGFVVPEDKLQRLGVRTAEAGPRRLVRTIRAVGTIQVDERLQAAVNTKFDGYVTRLHVATTGAPVRRGQPLLEVYSPELVSAQEEYLIAQRNLRTLGGASPEVKARLERLVEASVTRLRYWDIELDDLPELAAGSARRTVLVRSPVDGVVLDKRVVVGQRFMPGETLYQVAGLSRVWLIADVFEQDLGAIAPGRTVRASFAAYPGRTFRGTVSFAYPDLEDATRTLPVRIEMSNPDGALKPGLYGSVEIEGGAIPASVTVPESAVLDSGTRTLVFVARPGGRFETREVTLGARGDGHVAVLTGLAAGEPVVIDGNFLIDAESNLRAGTQALGHVHAERGATGAEAPPAPAGRMDSADQDAQAAPGAAHAGHDPAGAATHEGHGAPGPAAREGHQATESPARDAHDAHQNH